MALLAILCDAPAHGYQLRTEFEHRTGSVWPLNVGQVYTTLQRLERDGLVVCEEPSSDGQVVHHITKAGQGAVNGWFGEPIDRSAPPRDELAMKLSLAASSNIVDVGAVIQQQRTASMRALRDLTRLKPDVDAAFESPEVMGWSLALDSMVFSIEAEIRWLDHVEGRLVAGARRKKKSVVPRASETTESNSHIKQPTTKGMPRR